MTAVEKLAARVIDEVLEATEKANSSIQVEEGSSLLHGDDYFITEDLIAGIIGDWVQAQAEKLCLVDVDLPQKGE